jgi:hypothetical protein
MHQRNTRLLLVLVAVVLAASVALAQVATPFSADTKTTSKGSVIAGKMFMSGAKMRMEMNIGGRQVISIVDSAARVMYSIMPEQHMYMEMHTDQMMAGRQQPTVKPYDPANPCANEAGATCKKVGTETVNGRMCDRWEFTGGKGGPRTVWIDQRVHVGVRTISGDTTIDVYNIQESPQPASLFVVPPGYTKMDMSNMMHGMQNQQH